MERQQKINRIIGVVLIVASLSAIAFWEFWGRENLAYDSIAVLNVSVPQNTIIDESMINERKVEHAEKGAIKYANRSKIMGMETTQYVAQGSELFKEYFQESKFSTGGLTGQMVLSLPENWLSAFPQTLRRGDMAYFYCGDKLVTQAVVIHVRDSSNQEVTYSNDGRLTASSTVKLIEIIVNSEQAIKLNELAGKDKKLLVLYN